MLSNMKFLLFLFPFLYLCSCSTEESQVKVDDSEKKYPYLIYKVSKNALNTITPSMPAESIPFNQYDSASETTFSGQMMVRPTVLLELVENPNQAEIQIATLLPNSQASYSIAAAVPGEGTTFVGSGSTFVHGMATNKVTFDESGFSLGQTTFGFSDHTTTQTQANYKKQGWLIAKIKEKLVNRVASKKLAQNTTTINQKFSNELKKQSLEKITTVMKGYMATANESFQFAKDYLFVDSDLNEAKTFFSTTKNQLKGEVRKSKPAKAVPENCEGDQVLCINSKLLNQFTRDNFEKGPVSIDYFVNGFWNLVPFKQANASFDPANDYPRLTLDPVVTTNGETKKTNCPMCIVFKDNEIQIVSVATLQFSSAYEPAPIQVRVHYKIETPKPEDKEQVVRLKRTLVKIYPYEAVSQATTAQPASSILTLPLDLLNQTAGQVINTDQILLFEGLLEGMFAKVVSLPVYSQVQTGHQVKFEAQTQDDWLSLKWNIVSK